jgi:ATP-dependent 26S proteasome regulatory subunit
MYLLSLVHLSPFLCLSPIYASHLLTIPLPSTLQLCYDDVIGYAEVKKSLRRILSLSSPAMADRVLRFGLKPPGGALLYGPPGKPCRAYTV